MKKITLLSVLVVIINTSFAQFNLSVEGGLQISDVVPVNEPPEFSDELYGSKLTPTIGILTTLPVSKLAVTTGIHYNNKGVKDDESLHLHYLGIPVLVNFNLLDQLKLETGPELNYLLSAKASNGNELDFYNTWDFGFKVGLSYPIINSFSVRANYYIGLSNIIDNEDPTLPENFKLQNRSLHLTVAYKVL